MPFQYIHTSARRGLEPGKSGFCCIARDRELPRDLGIELERMSRFDPMPGKSSPVIYRHITLSVRSGDFNILTRIQDAGIDYSKRNNHIAHHLAFPSEETAGLPDPATLLLYWNGWKNAWHEPPRILNERDQFNIQDLNTLSEESATPFESSLSAGQPVERAFTIPEGSERDLLLHFRSQLLSIPVGDRWRSTFTNFILTSERPTQYKWRGNWEGRALPFEFEATAENVELSEATPEQPNAPVLAATSSTDATEPEFKPRAPTVEIPEELTAAHRRRPKRRWTQKRFSRTLNLGLGIVALLCVVTFVYIVSDLNSPEPGQSEERPTPKPAFTPDSPAPIPATARQRWDALVSSAQITENLEEGRELSKTLAAEGSPRPERIVQALAAILNPNDSPNLIPIDRSLVSPVEDRWELDSVLAAETARFTLSLVPEPLFPFFNETTDSSHSLPPLELPPLSDQFILVDTLVSIKTLYRQTRDALNRNGIEAVTAAEGYLETWQSLEGDKDLDSIQKLETLFGIDTYEGFLAVDENGLLLTPNQTDIGLHIRKLYEQFILPRFSSFGTSPEFRLALNAAGADHDTAISLARAIYEVFVQAQPVSTAVETKLASIRSQWRETFIREDLMEETIINFNLERLANSKRSLARLQFQFTPSMIDELEDTRRVLNSLQSAETALAQIDRSTRWALLRQTGVRP